MAAVIVIPIAVKALTTGIAALSQHTAKLQAATNENQAADLLIPAFDSDLKAVAAAYNSGTPASECIAALQAIDTNAYNYLRGQVGKAGTSWSGPSSATIGNGINPTYGAACDKTCTVGCCLYLNDLRPAIFGRGGVGTSYGPFQTAPGIVGGMIGAIQKGGGTIHVITVAPPSNTAYGNYQRAGYDIKLATPPPVSVSTKVLTATGSGSTFAVTAAPANAVPPPAPTTTQGGSVPLSTTLGGVTSALTNSTAVTILAVVGGLVVLLTALFGPNSLRVDN